MLDPSRHLMLISGWTRKFAVILCGISLTAGLEPASLAQSTPARITFANGVKQPVTKTANAAVNKNLPTVVRSQLTDAETQETIDFSVALKMRNFAGLQGRIGRGEIIPLDEMHAKYFPAFADVENVRQWLIAQGFDVQPPVQYQVSIFARGTVAQLQRAFGVTFARVQFHGEEHTSAITAPSLPTDIAVPVLSINGLQPHLHPFPHSIRKATGVIKSISNQPPYLVSEISGAYDASSDNGTGQKIGIVIDTFPLNSDLTTFWNDNGVSQSLANIEEVQVVSGRLSAPSGEETLDTEWSSGIASGAKVRIYGTTDLALDHLDQAYQYIINDLPNQPALHQLSLSYGLGEDYMPAGQMDTDAQYFGSLASQGVGVFVSSGDGGSNPGTDGEYSPTNPVQVESPANDPNVTAVGGTSLYLNSNGTVSGETAWFDGTGGGQSQHFSRPAWQPGSATISGNGRLVPDVALDADPNTGVLVILKGKSYQFGGTSLSAPIWAGFCARLNQTRAGSGSPAIGLLGPNIYPDIGSIIFRDITAGSNGMYGAGPGFDLCTGIGVPSVNNLISALSGSGPVDKDFNGDGFADLVLENIITGRRMVWLLRDGVHFANLALPTIAPSWHIAGAGDFLGNGHSDLVLENSINGRHLIWILQNGAIQSEISLPATKAWHVVGAGDFNGDSKADLVLENLNTGRRQIWLLNNGAYSSGLALPTIGVNWHIAGVGDFLGNGQSDLVLENTITGKRQLWILNNGVRTQSISLGNLSLNWRIGGAADFDGDGQADLALENIFTGRRMIWVLKNGVHASTFFIQTINTNWHIVDH
jgi:kumamolisin